MHFVQKRRSVTHRFDFHADAVTFQYKDRSGSGEAKVSYGDVAAKPSVRIEENAWWRNLGALWIVIGILQLGFAFAKGDGLAGRGFWLLAGCVCLVVHRWTRISYSVFSVGTGGLFVIQEEKHHDAIVHELLQRRSAQLKRWYGSIDVNGEPDKEIARFQWLVTQQALTQPEADALIATVQAGAVLSEPGRTPHSRLH
ncbi:hypothetical protein [Pseudorhodoferax sp. Leaf265]|uniref:hypothetical protein n=1 Tax=Pseudorhodoferax sp. Leaf265 TaxID=1736315 RepID=UPI0006FD927B|nr:hypothetical protein [Pseudorhodoferax sp. Leaf265]KQP12041.1 hypothetical protein ASF45_32050 [Pseudorhodoferax sp. Leaf265]